MIMSEVDLIKILLNSLEALESVLALAREQNEQIEGLKEKHRWIPADDPPSVIDWDKKVQALEYESKIPRIMTMAEIFLDEGSEVEYWRVIILPQALGEKGQEKP